MKITIQKEIKKCELVFTIRCVEPEMVEFDNDDIQLMDKIVAIMDECGEKRHSRVKDMLNDTKSAAYELIEEKFTEAVRFEFTPKIPMMYKQIRQWMRDNQSPQLRTWISEQYPYAENYYFS